MCQVCAKVISASNNVFHSHPRKTTEVNRYISWRSPSPWTLVMFCGWSNRTFGMHSHGMLWVFQELPAVVPYMWVHGVSLEGLVPRWGELNRFIYDSDNVQNIVPYMLGIISESELLSWAYLWQCREHHAIWRYASIVCETCEGGRAKRCSLQRWHETWTRQCQGDSGSEYNEIGSD